jgi:hypothetical protein
MVVFPQSVTPPQLLLIRHLFLFFFCVVDRAGLPGGWLHLPGAVVPGVGRGGRDGGQGQGPDGPALTAGVSAALGPFAAEEAASEAAAARLTQSRQSLSLNYVLKVMN